jgi:hypothetical protein
MELLEGSTCASGSRRRPSPALPNPETLTISTGSWLPDGKHAVFLGSVRNEALAGTSRMSTTGACERSRSQE